MTLTEAEENYVKADRSDPFTRNRIIAHKKNEVASTRQPLFVGDQQALQPGGYTASERMEDRSFERDGETIWYKVPVYSGMKRP